MSEQRSHTASAYSAVVVGSKWRNKKSGIVAEVVAIRSHNTVTLKREKRAWTSKWIDLLLLDYELVSDNADSQETSR